jgi:hypothetical protein
LTANNLRELGHELQQHNEALAARAVLRLAAAPSDAVPFLREALKPLQAPPAAAIAQHVAALESDQFQVREAAVRALEQLGPGAREGITQALSGPMSLETRRRLERVLARLEEQARGLDPRLLGLRTALVLERAATADAVRFLQELAATSGAEVVRREASTALARLKGASR